MKQQYRGGPVDETLPGPALDLLEDLSRKPEDASAVAATTAQVAALVGRYREARAIRETTPAVAETLKALQSLAQRVETLRVDLEALPAEAEALLFETGYRAGFADLQGEGAESLHALARGLMAAARGGYAAESSNKGEKAKGAEVALLVEVARLVEPFMGKLELSAGYAARILQAAGVHGLPQSDKKARERIVAWEKANPRR